MNRHVANVKSELSATVANAHLRANGYTGTVRTLLISIAIGVAAFLVMLLVFFISTRNSPDGPEVEPHSAFEITPVANQLGVSNL